MTTGQKIKYYRELKGMSQEELAHACGFKGRSSITRIEKNNGGVPNVKLLKIAEVLEVSPEYLLGWKDWLPGQTNLLTEFGLNDYDYTVHPSKPTPRQRLLELINEAPDEKIDLLIDIAEAVIKGRKG